MAGVVNKKIRRHQKFYRHRHKPGTAPGTLIAVEDSPSPVITIIAYSNDELIETLISTPDELSTYIKKFPIVWVNIDGLGDASVIEEMGKNFNFHPLAMEDVLNTHQRPKVEEYDENLFTVMRMVCMKDIGLDIEQVSMFIGKNYVISFQERAGDCFNPVRERLRKAGKRIRMMESDYLAYALIDAIIDAYFPILEDFGDRLNSLEDYVIENPTDHIVEKIHEMKHNLHALRHDIWPMREALNRLSNDNDLIHEETKPYLRDCYDHVIQIIDVLETYRERASGLTDIYLSSLSNRMNEVMKVLTIIATLFIPLSFIAGVYGMNFDPNVSPFNMPELRWFFGYPFALSLMVLIASALLLFFRSKGWIGKR